MLRVQTSSDAEYSAGVKPVSERKKRVKEEVSEKFRLSATCFMVYRPEPSWHLASRAIYPRM